MKRIIITFFLILITSGLSASYLSRTKTMNTVEFNELYDAIDYADGYDEVMRFYWDKLVQYASPNPTTRYEDDYTGGEEIRSDYPPIDISSSFAINSLIGALAVGYDTLNAQAFLDGAKDHLIYNPAPGHHDFYLSLDSLWVEYSDGSWSDCLSYGQLLNDVAFTVDMLWYYVNDSERDTLYDKLSELAGWANELLNDPTFAGEYAYTENHPIYPDSLKTKYHNGRIRLAGALGYAGCVLDSIDYIETAEYDLFERNLVDNNLGFIEFMTTNSGTYSEGMSYTEYIMRGLSKFLVARKRLYNEDWFCDERIKNIYVNSLDLISPTLSLIPFDDTFVSKFDYYGDFLVYNNSFSEMVTYFYHSPSNDTDTKDHIKWIINSYKVHQGGDECYFRAWSINKFYAYEHGLNLAAFPSTTPSKLSNGSISNNELTIMRRSIQNYGDYSNYPVLIVNHENSISRTSHEDSDQSSFVMYYKDKQLLIDPGYRPAWHSYNIGREWLTSPFAHNLIMVNPYHQNYLVGNHWEEVEELEDDYYNTFDDSTWNDPQEEDPNNYLFNEYDFEPIGMSGGYEGIELIKNPAYKNFYIKNIPIQQLQIEVTYDHPSLDNIYPSDKINDTLDITRNFYSFDLESENPYFIIFDEIKSSDHSIDNEFMNQLHFALYPVPGNNNAHSNEPDSLSDVISNNGIFSYKYFDDSAYLHGLSSSFENTYYTKEDSLPQGIYYGKNWDNNDFSPPQWEHKCLRTYTNSSGNTSFLTILIPSESSTNPITSTIKEDRYYAVEVYDETKTPTEKSYYAVSDTLLDVTFADINIKTDEGFEGLTYRPGYQGETKIAQFIKTEGDSLLYNNVLLFKTQTDIEEVMASYTGTELEVIVKSDAEFPQYKILRQGVQPSNFTSIGVENKENGSSNISNMWYDEEYFYVNWYDFTSTPVNLVNSIYVPEEDDLSVGEGVTVNCLKSDVNIEIDGGITIGDSVTFTCPDSITWGGLYLNNEDSTVIMENVTFERGKVVSKIYQLELDNCEFIDSEVEHNGVKLYADSSNFEMSGICSELDTGKSPGQVSISLVEITNSSFSDYSGFPIEISDYYNYNIINNNVSQCNNGISIFKCGNSRSCTISNNLIENNTGPGIQFYNSYIEVMDRNVIRENSYGIVGLNKCSFKMIGAENYPLQRVYDNTNEEIIIEELSYPQEIICNSITDDDYEIGQPDQYLMKCMDDSVGARTLDAEWNYWGSASLEWDEWDGDDRFYPNNAFDYIPVWDPGIPRGGENSDVDLLYAEADSLTEEEEYENAKTTYHDIIDFYPLTDYAVYSMLNLFSLETVSGQNFMALRNYYLTNPNCNINPERTKLSEYLANYCRIKMEQYPEAISFFEDIISNPETELDSVFAVIDAGYVYTLMGDNKAGYVGKMPELKPKSKVDFVEKRDNLITEIILGIEQENEQEEIPEYPVLKNNTPNPFKLNTNISFSIPNKSKVEIIVYNIKGQRVKSIVNDKYNKGWYNVTWDGTDNYGREVGSGVYFYRLKTENKEFVKKMLLIK